MKSLRPIALAHAAAALAAAIGLVISAGLSPRAEAQFPPKKVRSQSLKPVDIALVNSRTKQVMRLRVPKAYLVSAENWRGGNQEIINIETRLPDLRPKPALPEILGRPGSAEYQRTRADFANGVAISLSARYADPQHFATSVLEMLTNVHRVSGAQKYEKLDSSFTGLQRFEELRCLAGSSVPKEPPTERCESAFREHFLSRATDQPSVHIICDMALVKYVGFHAGCIAYTSFRHQQLFYVFRYDQMRRWYEFDNGIRKLLNSFVVTRAEP